MKNLTLALASILVASVASAADLPRKSVPVAMPVAAPVGMNWTGFYTGWHVGYDFGKVKDSISATSYNGAGLIYGLQAGYDWQFSQFVVGLAVDGSLTNARGSNAFGSARVGYEASARLRLGYAINNSALVYATGGYALANLNGKAYLPFPLPALSENKNHNGFTVGLGAEFKLARNGSFFVEYRMTDYAKQSYFANTASVSAQVSSVRAGVNYRY